VRWSHPGPLGTRWLGLLVAFVVMAVGPLTAVGPGGAVASTGPDVLTPRLARLAERSVARSTASAQARAIGLAPKGEGSILRRPDGRILVDLRFAADDPARADDALGPLGATTIAARGPVRTIAIAPGRLDGLRRVAGLVSAAEVVAPHLAGVGRRALPAGAPRAAPRCRTGVVSEGDAQLEAALARSTYGIDGAGVKVGVLSDSFNAQGGAAADEATGDLPGPGNPCGDRTPITVLEDGTPSTGTDEGRAMLQVVHDLAPGAQLLFSTGFNGELDFANQIVALAAAGATVIIDDITYGDEPMYQDGPVAAAVNQVSAGGVSFYSAAGNLNWTAAGHSVGSYEALRYRPTACPSPVASSGLRDCHDFDPGPGVDPGDVVNLAANATLDIDLGWSEPRYGVTTNLDFFLVDTATNAIVESGTDDNGATGLPSEFLFYGGGSSPTRLRLVIGRRSGTGTPRLKWVSNQTRFTAVQWNASSGTDVVGPTIYGHNAAMAAVTVGAVPADDSSAAEPFTSQGPATYCWAPAVSRTPAAARPCVSKTVTLAASDKVSTSGFRSGGGLNPFVGNSASAPAAAAVDALVRQARPCHTRREVLAAMIAAARPVGGADVDAVGAGLVDAVDAVAALAACPGGPAQPPPGGGSSPPPGSLPSAPGTPVVVSATGGTARLRWRAPSRAGSSAVADYLVSAYTPGLSTPVRSIDTASTALTASMSGLSTGRAYRFSVVAKNRTGTGTTSAFSAYALPPFATVPAFVDRQFRDFASRPPNRTEAAKWLSALVDSSDTAASRVDGASRFSFWGPKVDPVIRLYYAYFGRMPDIGGLTAWADRLRFGVPLDHVADAFAGSSEFRHTYGSLGDQAFVELVYRNVLGRGGDRAGITYWTDQITRRLRTRGGVMAGFSESREHRTRRAGEVNVIDIFVGMIRRVPTTGELAAALPAARTSREPVITTLLNSHTYAARL